MSENDAEGPKPLRERMMVAPCITVERGLEWVDHMLEYGHPTAVTGPRWTAAALVGIGLLLTGCGEDVGTDPPPTPIPSAISGISGDGQDGFVDQTLLEPLVVGVTTASGSVVSGVSVTWVVTAGGGSLSSSNTTTNAQGQASVTWTLGPVAGTDNNTATASVAGLAGSPVTFTASASYPHQDFSGSYTVHSMSQGTAASVTVLPGVTGTFSMTATTYHVAIDIPIGGVSIVDNGTYTAIGTPISGEFSQQSTDNPGLLYQGTYSWDASTNRLTLDTSAQGVRTVLVIQKI